jgi:hypothetical protein
MSFINSLLSLHFSSRHEEISFFRQHPGLAQSKVFFSLLQKAASTKWGNEYGYQGLASSDDFDAAFKSFREAVPLSSYDDLQPWIKRVQQGEKNVLWPSDARWFAKSSGTTSDKSKFIPVSTEALEECHYRGGKDVMSLYLENYPSTNIFTGKTLSIGGSYRPDVDSNIYCGDLSAILMDNMPFWAQFFRVPEISIALLDEWEEKIERIARSTIGKNVVALAGVPSWTLVILRRILEITGKSNILEVWPELELFVHGGVSFAPYRLQFQELIPGSQMHYMEAYNASEGFFAIGDDEERDDMLLMLDYGVFFEFIPLSELSNEKPFSLSASEVELGKNYALAISTNGGLWRYLIGDTVEITSVRPLRIKISGRTKHFLNVFGEELMVGNTDKAIQNACSETGSAIKDYTVAPIFMAHDSRGGHEWLIEFSKIPADLSAFSDALDRHLKEANSDYEAKRHKDIALQGPLVKVAREGLFHDWLKSKGKLGGQNKVPRLSNSRQHLEELLDLQ